MALGSIVDYLRNNGKDGSYTARKKLADQYGIGNYSGTAAQNSSLLNILQNKKAPVINSNATGTINSDPVLQKSSAIATGGYSPSEKVNDYYKKVQDMDEKTPDQYHGQYKDEIDGILEGILNKKEFSYSANDLMNDDLYKMYRDSYMRQGNMAMRDTMGNASALTGGYGSSYASAAGQQSYDNYVSALNNKSLEFADRAYDRYRDDRADTYSQLEAVSGLDNIDYSRYRDEVGDHYTNRDYLNKRYDQEYGYDYGKYQNTVEQQRWAEEFAFQKQQAAQEQDRWTAEMAASKSRGKRGSGTSVSSNKKTSSKYKLSVNEAVSILDKINRSEGTDAATAEAQRMISNGELADEKGDMTPAQRIARMVDQWQYQQKKGKSKK